MSNPTYSVPGKYKPLIEAEQARLALPSKSETLESHTGRWEVYISYVDAWP